MFLTKGFWKQWHYNDVIMGAIASQITILTIVYSIIYSDADQRKPQSSASLDFVRGIYRGPVNSPHKWPVTWKMFPFDDVIVDILLDDFLWYCLHLIAFNDKVKSNQNRMYIAGDEWRFFLRLYQSLSYRSLIVPGKVHDYHPIMDK